MALEPSEELPPPRISKQEPKHEVDYDNLDAYRDFINSLDVLDEFGKD